MPEEKPTRARRVLKVSMDRTRMADLLSAKNQMSKRFNLEMVDSLFDIIRGCLTGGGVVRLPGVGLLFVDEMPPRKGRNPRRGTSIMLDARRKVKFRMLRGYSDYMNKLARDAHKAAMKATGQGETSA